VGNNSGNNSGRNSGSNGDSTALVPQDEEGGIAFVRFSPTPPFDQRLVFWQQSASDTAASFRLLRQRLIERGDPRSMLCTSAVRGEGTTTVSANLAMAFAELGKYRVLLIEASFRRAALAEVFGFKPPKGFALQLARHRAFPTEPWVVVQVGQAPLYVLAVEPRVCPHCSAVIAIEARFCGMCGKDVASTAAASLDAVTFSSAIKRFRAAFDYIVVDAPPVLASGDVNLIQDTADAIVIATRRGRSEARHLRRALNQVAPAPVAAVVLLDA
jgi:polysaccharide biosynthesis transport protein